MALQRLQPAFRPQRGEAGRGRILYVEDDDANWRVTERYLRSKYELRRGRNSGEAFELLSREVFQLLLLDIELAGSDHDGIGICRILRGIEPLPRGFTRPEWLDEAVPIVFVTAYAARYPREELLALGGNEVVTKPVDYTRLLLVSSRLMVRRIHDSEPARVSRPGSDRPSLPGKPRDPKA